MNPTPSLLSLKQAREISERATDEVRRQWASSDIDPESLSRLAASYLVLEEALAAALDEAAEADAACRLALKMEKETAAREQRGRELLREVLAACNAPGCDFDQRMHYVEPQIDRAQLAALAAYLAEPAP